MAGDGDDLAQIARAAWREELVRQRDVEERRAEDKRENDDDNTPAAKPPACMLLLLEYGQRTLPLPVSGP